MKLSLNTQKKCAEGFVTRTRLLVLIGKFLIDLRIKKNHLKNSLIFLSARKNRSKEFKLRELKN
ncbi:hypothetical protein LEP1GSC083_4943 [Leptospira interrogans serovar Pyrogenes str. L0374]|uniref:Uncharacterized protein n=1 Tax=Leptospira interrogans serovar Pyrogenes str. L0374 TaxID=1049928 RepID=M6K234_LEPIR|nr:hypothetical protein LEP1GSC083_4943 [Leptospira interrogans serovar Pyrogenes str. L0374]